MRTVTTVSISAAILVFVAALGIVYVLSAGRASEAENAAEKIRTSALEACDRGNVLRQAVYENTLADARSRQSVASQFTGHDRQVIQRIATEGFQRAEDLVTSSAEVAVAEGSVVHDCEKAYPEPK